MRGKLVELIANGERQVLGNTLRGTSYYTEALADYLLAEGVIVPPFTAKVGDKVYRIMCRGYKDFFIREETIWIVDNHATAGVEVITKYLDGKGLSYFPKVEKEAIGKTVFLTREAAEKVLERSENGT